MGRPAPPRYRFGSFELDSRSGELQRDGVKMRLQEQSLQTLLMLIEHAGDIVTREQLRHRVWQDETFVDFEHGLNSIVKRLRVALGDSAENSAYIETLPRRGYRFLPQVEAISIATATAGPIASPPVVSSAAVMTVAAEPPHADIHLDERARFDAWWMVLIALIVSLGGGVLVIRHLMGKYAISSARGQVRLAVLPFENLTGNQDQQFFADGLHEEMIFRLGRMQPQRLAVIARTSVMPYHDASKSIAMIARELGVDFVLEGSVRHAGERFRITAQLIRASDQSHLWTETYDRSWKDIFAIQSDVGARVADSLAVELLPSSQAAAANGNVSPKAYEHYLKGRFYWNQRQRDPSPQLARAIEQFRLAIAEQPDYALAYAGLADSYNSIFFSNPSVGDGAYSSARNAIQRALELDERLASAYSTLAWMTMHFEHDLPLAERTFQRALELEPNDSLARFRHAHLLAIRGRLAEAEREAEAARQYDPLSAPISDILAWFSYYRRSDTQAQQRMQQAADLEGNPTKSHVFAAYMLAVKGDCERAVIELGLLRLDVEALRMGEAVFVRARCDKPTLTEGLRRELVARRFTYPAAMFHFGRGEMEPFYDWLNRAIDERFPEVLYLGVDPVFSRERQSARFQAALRRIGL